MAVIRTPGDSTLRIRVQTGIGASGQPVYRNRSYNNVKAAATDDDVYAVAQAIAGLQQHPVNSIIRIDDGVLAE